MKEDVAQIVYEAMRWAARTGPQLGGHTPDWVQGGNSNSQDEARSAASRIASLYEPILTNDKEGI
jgi:hypothetical protein